VRGPLDHDFPFFLFLSCRKTTVRVGRNDRKRSHAFSSVTQGAATRGDGPAGRTTVDAAVGAVVHVRAAPTTLGAVLPCVLQQASRRCWAGDVSNEESRERPTRVRATDLTAPPFDVAPIDEKSISPRRARWRASARVVSSRELSV